MSGQIVSVVIPAYNSSATIGDALGSVWNQDDRRLEVIVVDDASVDGTADRVREWARDRGAHLSDSEKRGRRGDEYPNILLLCQHTNQGPGAARNRGVEAARGEWVAFLDADDLWVPRVMKKKRELCGLRPEAGFVCGESLRFNSEDELAERMTAASAAELGDTRRLTLDEFVRHNPVATSTVMMRKKLFDDVGGFDPRFRGPEDYDLWMRCVAVAAAVRTETPLALYRHVPDSLSMDERTFLPQVLGVLAKAFADGGAFSAMPSRRRTAIANQCWNASWMAFNRGSRRAALRLWLRAFALNAMASERMSRPWGALLYRYLFGRRVGGGRESR